MAKNIRTSGDYFIQSGLGSVGSNKIVLDAAVVEIKGNINIDGTQTVINSASLSIEDRFIELNRNNSTVDTLDSGIFFNRGTSNAAVLYWDAGDDEFLVGTTSDTATATTISNINLANLKVATVPTHANHAASKSYVDGQGTLKVAGDDSTVIGVAAGSTLQFLGTGGISTASAEPDTLTIGLDRDLSGITSITSDASNGDLTLAANGTGNIVINDTLSFSGMATDPTATAQTKLYNKTAGGGGTGLYFRNSNIGSGAVGELISKSKATALAIALG
jgi:hypothetical protein